MLIKKIGTMLLALSLAAACIPGTIASAANEWLDLELAVAAYDSALYPVVGSAVDPFNGNNTSVGEGVKAANEATKDTPITYTANIPETTEYDVYAITTNYSSNITSTKWAFEIAGNEYVQGATEVNMGYAPFIPPGVWFGIGWTKIAEDVALTAGANTIKAYMSGASGRSDGYYLNYLDTVRIVPSSWNWTPDKTKDDPVQGDPQEWYQFDAHDSTTGRVISDSPYTPLYNGNAFQSDAWTTNNVGVNEFMVDVATNYDIWAIVGVRQSDALGNYTFTLNDGTSDVWKYDENMSVAYLESLGRPAFCSANDLGADGTVTEMKWVKLATNQTINAKKHTFTSTVTESATSGNKFGVIDCIRIVPTSWNWAPDGASLAEPEKAAVIFDSFAFGDVWEGEECYVDIMGAKKTVDDELNAVLIAAMYKDGVLVEVNASESVALSKDTGATLSSYVTLPASLEGIEVKAFLWDGLDTAIPHADPLPLVIE